MRNYLVCMLLVGCEAASPFDDYLEQAGVLRFLGTQAPDTTDPLDDGAIRSAWTPTDTSPICLDGSPFRVFTRDGTSKKLTIFLQGGGACWSSYCLAAPYAPETYPRIDVTDPTLDANPYRDHNVVYVPYCDGSLFVGDTSSDSDGDGVIDRTQRGLRNLSAALDVALATYPDPDSITLIGASGGAYATFLAAPIVRHIWPDVPIDVVNDAGVGIGQPGDPAFIRGLLKEWEAGAVLPSDCDGCYARGHISLLASWLLDRDPNLRYAMLSSARDKVIGQWFLHLSPDAFESALLDETGRVEDAVADGRFARFIYAGDGHTATLGSIDGAFGVSGDFMGGIASSVGIGSLAETKSNGVSAGAWLKAMDDRQDWSTTVDTGDGSPAVE